jgi:hypothetical protein
MPAYRLDPLHPTVIVCEVCARAVAPAPAGLAATEHLTGRQLVLAGLDGAAAVAVAEHDVLCAGAWGAGVPVYVRLLPRNDEDGQ